MIFVTVGTDLPFDRLVRTVDEWAAAHKRTDIFAQIGKGGWRPGFIESAEFLDPPEFTRLFTDADFIVAHAGMGTILSALRYGKPTLVMPRRASLGEQRNEHQLATARHLSALGKVDVAFDGTQLMTMLDNIHSISVRGRIGRFAEDQLQTSIREFIWNGRMTKGTQPASNGDTGNRIA